MPLMIPDFSNEEGRRKKEEGIPPCPPLKGGRKKWIGTQTLTNYQHPVDGGVLNLKEKDKVKKSRKTSTLLFVFSG